MWSDCTKQYVREKLDHAYVAGELGIPELMVTRNLHVIKHLSGVKGRSIWLCLDQGDVYDPVSQEYLGNICDG